MEAAPSGMASEGAKEVDEGTQKIVEEDLCGLVALVMMPLDQTVLYITHRLGPLAAEISAVPVIDVSAQPCAPEDCPLGPFVHEEEELEAPTPSQFPVIATQPGSLMVVCERQVGGMAMVKDIVDLPVAQVLRWDVAGTHPRVVDTSVVVQSGLLVANPERLKEYWCPCQQVCACSVVGLKLWAKRASGGGGGVVGMGAGRGSCCESICWKGAEKVPEGVPPEGSAGSRFRR